MPHVIYAELGALLQTGASPHAAGGARHVPTILELVGQATIPVKVVIVLLVGLSLACWYIIAYKAMFLSRASRDTDEFLKTFYETQQFATAAERVQQLGRSPVAQIFKAGYEELLKVRARAQAGQDAGGVDNVERAMRRAGVSELTTLESMLPILATTGSTGPFIGLFGTVYGIMHAFLQLSGSQDQSTIDRVGPGIAEALFTTAIGLVAAIPAVMAYNYFIRRIRVLTTEMEVFQADMLNIVRRHFLK